MTIVSGNEIYLNVESARRIYKVTVEEHNLKPFHKIMIEYTDKEKILCGGNDKEVIDKIFESIIRYLDKNTACIKVS